MTKCLPSVSVNLAWYGMASLPRLGVDISVLFLLKIRFLMYVDGAYRFAETERKFALPFLCFVLSLCEFPSKLRSTSGVFTATPRQSARPIDINLPSSAGTTGLPRSRLGVMFEKENVEPVIYAPCVLLYHHL